MNLDTLIRDQNQHWTDPAYSPPEADWYHRPFYKLILQLLEKQLIITLTGLRRVGKSTIAKQILANLIKKYPPAHLFYFSFDESVVKNESETLREILETYAVSIVHQPLSQVKEKIFIFLDEIQIIPDWASLIKTYYDLNPNLQFIITGSSSLFISRKSTESLAGRIREIIIPPLSFLEYLELNQKAQPEISKMGLEKYACVFPEYLNAFFENYLKDGQFPQPINYNYSLSETRQYLQTIEEKIIEIDLPKVFPVKRTDILKIIFNHFKSNPGCILTYGNLANDLGVDVRTVIKHIDWLEKAFLINMCRNQTPKIAKSARAAKKIYLTSANFSTEASLGHKVENYVFNFLKNNGLHPEFFRFHDQEVDFIIRDSQGQNIPWEVKYQERIQKSDEKQLLAYAKRHNSSYAFLITKNPVKNLPRKIGSTVIYYLPASQIELSQAVTLMPIV